MILLLTILLNLDNGIKLQLLQGKTKRMLLC